ncbi:RNA polymerase sigma factor FliA [Pseudoalteromonas sp. THAF3]|uniref:RNA polymerase sigma factor FliA n=1 Tax=Pseudoalteromonas ruthenica TaxID=151081 RepID=A0A0F4PQC5_9GAMM|nr:MULTISPECIES: RNA polymerase sigma factor FliA [Pseudoalteromonas]KJY97253.1 RNA polymerase sigma 70 [Pseudoalteromonas ruthenica]KJY99567.1 RNA polymerase sigma 70 [Pseudoalteromonas ruthenica]MCF2863486.1 RNA polymerase sigma factor FliA [Pseudoalteromonas sp. CNAT2-18]MCG7544833.1 RNA polymerase sigma factor FliA [Pseudoalteromonas sp. MM17-2]MCG7558439.1 RNA polymerase sigma factor FliA [Pseudoalteromonas sp. CNAT2-18.1]|tara:strand:- start:1690 stop:2412 length:723 start_codon:yes stop_codon:yes gene_type:complete
MNKVAGYQDQLQLNTLVERHAALVKRVACHLLARLPASVQLDDLIQSGMIGLIEASKTFDASKGASFETFAGIRIRGAMLDEVRRGDWAPRSVHRNSRAVATAVHELETSLGREPKDVEVAEKLDISLDEYHHILNDVNCSKVLGIEDLGVDEDVLTPSSEQSQTGRPYTSVHNERFNQALVAAINSLPERDALVLSLYYNDEMNLKEIGQILDVSESRVSQIHGQAMIKLKAKVNDWVN